MKKHILLSLIIIAICCIAHGTQGRIRGLGVNQIFYNDDQLMTVFPHYLSQYMNNAYIDAYYNYCGYQYSGGLNFRIFGADVGAYINKDFPISFDYHYVKLDKAMNLYYTKEGFGLGLDVAFNYYHTNDQPPGKSLDETVFGIGGKMGYKISEIDIGFKGYYAYGVSTHENVAERKIKSIIVKMAARKELFKTEKSVIYPALQVELQTTENKVTYPTQPVHENKITSSTLSAFPGIGLNYTISDHILVIAAASCGGELIKVTDSSSDKMDKGSETSNVLRMTFPKLELGLEAYLAKWLIARAGIKKSFYYDSVKHESTNETELKFSYLDSDFSYSFGLGLTFGKYSIDWQISDDLLRNGPFVLTGKESAFSSSLSMKFCFN